MDSLVVLIMYILEYNSTYLSICLLPRYLVAMATLLLEILPIVLVDKKEREKEKETERKKIANQNSYIPKRLLETFPLRVSYQLPPLTRDRYLLIRGVVEYRKVECRKVEEREREKGRERVYIVR